jgi:multiple sugar transport system ATP-binding protein
MEIKLQQLTKIFQAKDKTETVAVKDFEITIPSGKLVGLLGPSGCGKSTTLYMIAGLLKPNNGKIFFGDEDVTEMAPEDRGIGLVFQNYALYPHMTVRQNIMFPLENLKVPKVEANIRAQEMADLVGIGELMNRKPKQLSGGQQQRVAIARALVKKPRVLLLDEPLSNLDARLRLQTREEIKRIQRETGITTIFVTHDQEEAMSISDEIVLMEFGIKKQVGEPQDVYDKPDNLFVAKFLGTPPINIFNGEIINKEIHLNGAIIGKTKAPDQEVVVGIRPEGFKISKTTGLELEINMVETIGRDTTLIINDIQETERSSRVIIDSSNKVKPGDKIKFSIKPNKLFLFNKETGERIT